MHFPLHFSRSVTTTEKAMPSSKSISKTFQATLERTGDRLHWVIICVPLDVHKVWGVRGQLRVKGEIRPVGLPRRAGFPFRTSLFPPGRAATS